MARRSIAGQSLVLLGVAIALATLIASAWVGPHPSSPAEPAALSTDSTPSIRSGITVHPSVVVGSTGSEFRGIDLYPQESLTSVQGNELAAAAIHFVRWPSGKLNDGYDLIRNVIHFDDRAVAVPTTSPSEFVRWCESTGCHAILGVPGEIDDPAYAAAEVRYVEQTLGFHPAFWEIGNEPALWNHFGIPWGGWSVRQHSSVSPSGFAALVHRYVVAMRAVDPHAPIVGLPGTGLGAYGETRWVYDTVKANGPELAAVALHVYPAGHSQSHSGSLARFDASLLGSGSLSARVPHVDRAIRAACPACRIQVLVTEINSASVGLLGDAGNYGRFMAGFPEVPYMAAQTVQALQTGVANQDVFELESDYPGALLTASGAPRPLDLLYRDVLSHLLPVAVRTDTSGAKGAFFSVATLDPRSGATALLVANANPATSVSVDTAGSGLPPSGLGTVWKFDSGAPGPSTTGWSGSTPGRWTFPPESVTLIQILPPSPPGAPPPSGPPTGGAPRAPSPHPPRGVGEMPGPFSATPSVPSLPAPLAHVFAPLASAVWSTTGLMISGAAVGVLVVLWLPVPLGPERMQDSRPAPPPRSGRGPVLRRR